MKFAPPFLLLAFYLLLGFVLHFTHGHYAKSHIEKIFILFSVLLPCLLFFQKLKWSRVRLRVFELAMAFSALFSAFYLQRGYPINHGEGTFPGEVLKSCLISIYILTGGLFLSLLLQIFFQKTKQKPTLLVLERISSQLLFTLYLFIFIAFALVPWVSPDTFIDVFRHNTEAVDYLLSGKNPYMEPYPQIYGGKYGYKEEFAYFPGLLFWIAPFRLLFGDIRYAYIFSHGLICLTLWQVGRHLKLSRRHLRLLPLLWLLFPVGPFVLEQSWIDTNLVAFSTLGIWAILTKQWTALALLLGFMSSFKQYGIIIAGFFVLWLFVREGYRLALKSSLIIAGLFAAILGPFVIAHPREFYLTTIHTQIAAFFRTDGLNFTIYLYREWGITLPSTLSLPLVASGTMLCLIVFFRKQKLKLAHLATTLFISFSTAFLWGKWAFCNYYYLLVGFLILTLLFYLPEESSDT